MTIKNAADMHNVKNHQSQTGGMINVTPRVVLEHLKNEILDDYQSSWNFEASEFHE